MDFAGGKKIKRTRQAKDGGEGRDRCNTRDSDSLSQLASPDRTSGNGIQTKNSMLPLAMKKRVKNIWRENR